MKQRCPRQPRIGETCGAKLVDTENLTRLDEDCRVCQEKAVKERRMAREKDNIRRWATEHGKFRASITKSTQEVLQLERALEDLEKRRTSVAFSKAPAWRDPRDDGSGSSGGSSSAGALAH